MAPATISQCGYSILGTPTSSPSFLRLDPSLTRQPLRSVAFVVRLELWLGLTVRYRLPRRQRIEGPSIGFVRDLLLDGSLPFDHLHFTFRPSSTKGGGPSLKYTREAAPKGDGSLTKSDSGRRKAAGVDWLLISG